MKFPFSQASLFHLRIDVEFDIRLGLASALLPFQGPMLSRVSPCLSLDRASYL